MFVVVGRVATFVFICVYIWILEFTSGTLQLSGMSDTTPPSTAASACTLIAPRRNIAGDFEWSVHSLPPLVRRHCVQLFPDRAPPDERTLIIVTVQRTQHDIIQMGADVDREKDVCLERFYAWGNDVMARLRADAAVAAASPPWADLIDPCSGIGLGRIVAIAWYPCGPVPC